jgi:hypothetical protein
MSPFVHPWTYSAKITGDQITFSIEVTDFKPQTGVIEISGQATQIGGAFAPIYATASVPENPNGDPDDDDQKDRSFVDVAATPTPDYPFRADQDVTVFVRVSQAWVTVLGEGTDGQAPVQETGPRAPDGNTWGIHKADARLSEPHRPASGSN